MTCFFDDLTWRGLVHQTTADGQLGKWLDEKPRKVYAGFDPTAESLHAGSLLPLLSLKRFQLAGHHPIALLGGATGMIGDPSGKSAERNLLSADQLERNIAGIDRQIRAILSDGPVTIVNNLDWIGQFSFTSFLRDVGKNFPVNVMLAKDSVRSRLEGESGLSYTEFSYMLLQAYDFVHLHRALGCELQIGGSDQWGNITAGIDLARRMDSVQLFGLTSPLLTKADGSKMGKTESGTIWLDPVRTSPYQFFQYWINVADEDAGKCLRFLTFESRDEIESLDVARLANPGGRESQQRLATWLTRLVHGEEGLARAARATTIFFGAEIENVSDRDLGEIFADIPSHTQPRKVLDSGSLSLADALVAVGLVGSKGEARRAVGEGGVYINNRRCDDFALALGPQHLASETTIVLRRGKKKYGLLRFSD